MFQCEYPVICIVIAPRHLHVIQKRYVPKYIFHIGTPIILWTTVYMYVHLNIKTRKNLNFGCNEAIIPFINTKNFFTRT